MGTLVNSRSGGDGASSAHPAVGSPYRKLGSPELQPLPPLTRHSRHTYADAEGGHSSDEEFYSPRDSTAEKENNGGLLGGQGSSSRRIFQVPVMDKCGDRSSPCYSSSNPASSPAPSSPCRLSPPNSSSTGSSILKSLNSHFANVVSDGDAVLHPPSPPPSLRPMTPSPPKRKPPSPSPPSSPLEKDLDNNAAASDVRRQNQKSAARTGGFERNPFSEAPQMPPPPPPLPPSGYWEGKSPRMPPLVFNPPPLVSPRHSGTQMAAVFPADSPRNSEDTERNHKETPRPKLKPLHWDKVWASSDRAMVWDHLKSSSFQLNEEMIEALFVCNSTNLTPREMARRQILPSLNQENRVLDPKKSQNIAILLRALNVTKEEVCEALCEGNTDSLGTELLETLLKMAPSKEEERKLKEYKDDSPFKLGSAEKFLKAVLDIPFAFKRVEAMLYITNFDADVNYLRNSFETLEAACDELKSSRMFLKLLEAVLKTGNRMNVGTNRGDAHAFKLDTLLKLVDVKGTDGKTTLLHFVVQEIVRAESSRLAAANQNLSSGETRPSTLDDLEFKRLGLQVVVGLSGELGNVKKAAAMDSGVLNTYVLKLAGGIGKISTVLRLNGSLESEESGRRFHDAISKFLITAEDEIARIQAKEHTALSLVKELTEYFHGNSAKEEAHPLRIFMVVRDFLSILDQVCKEVGKVNGRAIVGTARQFSALVTPPLPAVFPRFHAPREGSSDDSESSSSSS